MKFSTIMEVYKGRDANRTKALYAKLVAKPPRGIIAVNVLRAARNSEMAKGYKGRSAHAKAYESKDWAIGELCDALMRDPSVITSWGWGRDEQAVKFEDVLFLDLPGAGQISFHNSYRRVGPDYPGAWDGIRLQTARRVCLWVEAILNDREVITEGDENGISTGSEGARDEGDAGEKLRGVAQEKQEALDL